MLNTLKSIFKPVNLTEGKPIKVLLLFALPILLSTILNSAFSLINAIVLKYTVGGNAVTAINSTSSISNILFMFAYGCTSGFAVIISNKKGAQDEKGLGEAFQHSIIITFILGIIITVIGLFTYKSLLSFLEVSEAYIPQASQYYVIILLCFIFMLFSNLFGNFLRALGNSAVPLAFSIICTLINITFAFLLTGVIHWDTVGVAVATCIANITNTILCVTYLLKKYPTFRPKKGWFKMNKEMTLNLLKLGLPLGFQWSILFIGSFFQSKTINEFGLVTIEGKQASLAAKAVACYSPFEGYLTIPFSVMGSAILSYVGQNYGANNFKRIKEGIRDVMILDAIFYALIMAISIPLIKYVPYIFLPASEVNDSSFGPAIQFYCSRYLYIVIPCLALQAIVMLSRGVVQGIKKPMVPFISGIGELIVRILICLLLPSIIDPSNRVSDKAYLGVCFSNPGAWLVSTIIMFSCMIYFIYIKKYDNKTK